MPRFFFATIFCREFQARINANLKERKKREKRRKKRELKEGKIHECRRDGGTPSFPFF
jgi:hypothetical protein